MPTCDKCARGELHKRKHCNDIANLRYCVSCAEGTQHILTWCLNDEVIGGPTVIEGTGIIARIDRYTLSVDGHHIPANEDQERRIRALSSNQRRRLLVVLGQLTDEPDPDHSHSDSDDEETMFQNANGTVLVSARRWGKTVMDEEMRATVIETYGSMTGRFQKPIV